MQLIMPFGLPRWRGWCGGNVPQAIRGEMQAITCRVGLYQTFYRERAAYPESALEIRAVTSLGSVPLIVIARDPELGSVTPREKGLWPQIQQLKMKLSTNAELVIATGSDHDVPHARPDVIVAAVRKLAAQASGTGGQPGNSLRNALPM